MNSHVPSGSEKFAVRHRATSAQPPHASSPFIPQSSSRHAPHPNPLTVILNNPGALLEGLRCYPVASPLPLMFERRGKNGMQFFEDSQ